jgi:hypothetical protein
LGSGEERGAGGVRSEITAPRALMSLRSAFDALVLQATAVDALRTSCFCQCVVSFLFPKLPQPITGAFLGKLCNAASSFDIAVSDDDVSVRIVFILALVVDRDKPGNTSASDALKIATE